MADDGTRSFSGFSSLPLVGAIIAGFGWRNSNRPAADRRKGSADRGQRSDHGGFGCWLGGRSPPVVDHLPDLRRRDAAHPLLRWIESGTLGTEWAIRLDRLTAIMLVVVNSVSALVHLYSFGYMAHDDNWRRASITRRASLPICRSSPSPCWRW
jgi:NADH-quinone oxidoreductase subunit L